MQFIPGLTAEEAVLQKKVEPREAVRWIRDAALGVHDAHERGVIHRDLKPANLMVDTEGRVFVMDFGLAKLVGGQGSGTVSGVILGTPAFMPPEQAAGNAPQVDRRSDVYGLGASLYVLLSGRRPYEGDNATDILVQILTSEPPPLKQVWPEAPWELDSIVGRAMSRSREQRYPTAKDFADDLDRYLANEPVEAKRAGLASQAIKKIRRRGTPLGFAAAAVVIGGLALALYSRAPAPAPVVAPAAPDRLKEWSALFALLQPALGPESFDLKSAEALLARVDREFPEQRPEVDRYVEIESKNLARILEALPRPAWLESVDRVRRYRDWLGFTKQPTATADRILAYRGTFSLAIQVSPYAEVRSLYVEKLPAADRVTPLMVRDVEIGEAGLELVHQQLGSRSVTLPPLRNGDFIVLEGDLRKPETLKIREGP